MHEDRKYIIFPVAEINKVDFSQVLETSADTLRKSVDGFKTLIKWDSVEIPSFVSTIVGADGPYTYNEILVIMATPEWISPIPNP